MSSLDNHTALTSPAQTDREDAFDAEMIRREHDEGEEADFDALEAILCEMDKLKRDMLVAMYRAVTGAEDERLKKLAAMAQAAHDKEDEREAVKSTFTAFGEGLLKLVTPFFALPGFPRFVTMPSPETDAIHINSVDRFDFHALAAETFAKADLDLDELEAALEGVHDFFDRLTACIVVTAQTVSDTHQKDLDEALDKVARQENKLESERRYRAEFFERLGFASQVVVERERELASP
ncbi:A-agglutinin anchorage subunit [Rhodotorula toruloides ATCC 204091]|uniref:A-agglutinin anchorage subunit n=1 Tax=Rhodotorula toruloides TaxID=5286 RepID=A0A0K3C9J2_RHOTO|nr:A-agglutinin anchorage subunit [Rhodotorula toruloides ATCC 204091]KAK4333940.1 A-agglutinin anchorage subunit [Rhodotorula toruloides]PRQ76747.1 A-agglutinin anchorage subunit [Rhodotorula toruloides]